MAKKLKIKLPKRVAGVKIPKTVRKGPIADFLNSTAGQIVIAEALVAAAGAFAVKETDPKSPAGDALRHPGENLKRASRRAGRVGAHAASEAKEQAADQSARLSFALSEGMKAFRAAMDTDDWEQARGVAPDAEKRLEAQPVGKKKSPTRPSAPH